MTVYQNTLWGAPERASSWSESVMGLMDKFYPNCKDKEEWHRRVYAELMLRTDPVRRALLTARGHVGTEGQYVEFVVNSLAQAVVYDDTPSSETVVRLMRKISQERPGRYTFSTTDTEHVEATRSVCA